MPRISSLSITDFRKNVFLGIVFVVFCKDRLALYIVADVEFAHFVNALPKTALSCILQCYVCVVFVRYVQDLLAYLPCKSPFCDSFFLYSYLNVPFKNGPVFRILETYFLRWSVIGSESYSSS